MKNYFKFIVAYELNGLCKSNDAHYFSGYLDLEDEVCHAENIDGDSANVRFFKGVAYEFVNGVRTESIIIGSVDNDYCEVFFYRLSLDGNIPPKMYSFAPNEGNVFIGDYTGQWNALVMPDIDLGWMDDETAALQLESLTEEDLPEQEIEKLLQECYDNHTYLPAMASLVAERFNKQYEETKAGKIISDACSVSEEEAEERFKALSGGIISQKILKNLGFDLEDGVIINVEDLISENNIRYQLFNEDNETDMEEDEEEIIEVDDELADILDEIIEELQKKKITD